MTNGRDIDSYTLILWWDHDTRQIFNHTATSAFCRQFTETWQGEEYNRLWELSTVYDTLNETYAKSYNLSEHLAVDELIAEFKNKVIFRLTFQRKENALASKCTNFVMNQGIHMIWNCTWVETHTAPLMTWLQHVQLLDIWLTELKA